MKKSFKSLPARPNLEYLRSEAKELIADVRAGKPAAIKAFIAHLPAAKSLKPTSVRAAGFRLADAHSVIARQYGFDNWTGLARHVEQLRALEGEWAFESLETDGDRMLAPVFPAAQLQIDGARFRMASPEATYEGVFDIDVEEDPSHIDIEFVEGPEKGEWSYGIYALDGDRLTMCIGFTGSARPTRFATAKGSGHALQRLRRVSSKRPAHVTGGARTAPATKTTEPAAVNESAFRLSMTPLLERLQGDWVPVSL